MNPTIMIVDADDETRQEMACFLRAEGYEALEEADGVAAWITASTVRPDLIAVRRPEHVYGARLLVESVRASVALEGTRLLLVSPEEPAPELWQPDDELPLCLEPQLSCVSFLDRIRELLDRPDAGATHAPTLP